MSQHGGSFPFGKEHTKAILIAAPYDYAQDEMYGNKAEIHLQSDLTPENFEERDTLDIVEL